MPRGPGRRTGMHLWRGLAARPRLLAAVLTGGVAYALLPAGDGRTLWAWNAGAGLYLALMLQMVGRSSPERLRRRALLEDVGRFAILLMVALATAAVLWAVGSQLAAVKGLDAAQRLPHVGLAALTILSAWLFVQVLFALHYAHDFYAARAHGQTDPLAFPGTPDPSYRDFLYFAVVIGTSGQTADVAFQGSALRGVGTLHCVLAFFFNATLLALAVNIGAGLL